MKKILTFLCLITFSCYSHAQSTIAVGATCPDITIKDTKGVDHKLYDYCNAGKYVLIDFYAYWCGPCKGIAPIVEEFYKKYGCNSDNVIVLGNESDASATLADLIAFETSAGLDLANTYPSTYGSIGGAANKTTYGVSNFPTIILIGPDKRMKNQDIWPISGVATLEAAITAAGGTLTPKVCAPTSVKDIKSLEINIVPNPAYNKVNIHCEGINEIVVYNQVGSHVLSFNDLSTNSKTIDVSNLSTGVYFIEVKTAVSKGIQKFSKL